jgi:hypothetical protein
MKGRRIQLGNVRTQEKCPQCGRKFRLSLEDQQHPSMECSTCKTHPKLYYIDARSLGAGTIWRNTKNGHLFQSYEVAYKQLEELRLIMSDAPQEMTKMTTKENIEAHKTLFSDLIFQSRKRAKLKKLEFSITQDDLFDYCIEHNWVCSLTGIRFVLTSGHYKSWNPYRPSIDRIDSSKGYTKDNIRLVCSAVNIALHTWGLEVFDKIVQERLRWKVTKK